MLIDIEAPGQFETELSSIADIPMIRMERTGYGVGETAVFDVLGDSPQVIVTDDSGRQMDLAVGKVPGAEGAVRISCPLTETGLYTVKVTDGDRQAEGILTVHAPWQWILERAREGAWKYSQKATSHIESWYGFHSAFIAARYFPDKELDTKLTDRFEYLFNLLHDTVSMQPRYYSFRIQNTSGTIGMLVDRYQAHGDIRDLRRASRLADWLISEQQREDGAYVNRSTVYTSVIYIAKSMMELALAEREAAGQDTGAGSEDGDIRWAFVVDPYLRVTQACSADSHVTADSLSFGNPHPELYVTRSFVIGEQYVNMISDWQTVNTQDNYVHEVFKFIG